MSQADVDIQSIEQLYGGLNDAASEIASLRGEVRAYMDNALMQADEVVGRFRQIEAQCQHAYDSASAAYHSCIAHRRYDEESDSYTPSCDCEERDLDKAATALKEAYDKRCTAEGYLKDIESERRSYMEARHADYNMGALADEIIPEAVKRLYQFKELVENHESMLAGLTSSSVGNTGDNPHGGASGGDSSRTKANMFREATSRLDNSPVSRFREGMRRIKERQEEQQRLAILSWMAGGEQNERTR